MTTQPVQRRYRQSALIDVCRAVFAKGVLDHLPDYARARLCFIAERNIQTGRVTGILSRIAPEDLDGWMADYVRLMADTYLSEYVHWTTLRLRTEQGDNGLLAQVEALARRYAPERALVDDVVSESFQRVKLKLTEFPFDVPLDTWIERIVQTYCVALAEYARGDGDLPLDEGFQQIPRLNDDSVAELRYAERRLDLLSLMRDMSTIDRQILFGKIRGDDEEKIASTVSRSVKTVRNRLTEIKRSLHDAEFI